MKSDAGGTTAAGLSGMRTHTRRLRAVLLAAVTWRVRLVARGAPTDVAARETCANLARGRLVVAEESEERWTESAFPASRVAWDELRNASSAAGLTGVVLPNDPRLIDLLRNPDIIEARDDLKLSFG